jgi:hypothetical protein
MIGIQNDTLYRAYHYALRFVEVADTLGAQMRMNLVDLLTHINGIVGTFRLADITINAFICYQQSH